jgi:hypothetical protein
MLMGPRLPLVKAPKGVSLSLFFESPAAELWACLLVELGRIFAAVVLLVSGPG